METKVRQHRKYLKQSDFLKRQAAKEREANAKLGGERPEIHIPKTGSSVPEDPGTPEKDRLANISMEQDSESSSVSQEHKTKTSLCEIIFKGSPQPEQGLKSFYGDYNESRFDSQKTADVISVPSSPDDKSPIEIADSNEVSYHDRF